MLITASYCNPFGMVMPGTEYVDPKYAGGFRYGFNGMEQDDDVKGAGNSLDFGARIYDSRLGRWLSIDPLYKKFTSTSDFCFVMNNPLYLMDPDGRDVDVTTMTEEDKQEVKNEVEHISGRVLVEKNGQLEFKKQQFLLIFKRKVRLRDEDGNKIQGSSAARRLLKKAFNDPRTFKIVSTIDHITETINDDNRFDKIIRWNSTQVKDYNLHPSSGITETETNGLAMNFMHELHHAVKNSQDNDVIWKSPKIGIFVPLTLSEGSSFPKGRPVKYTNKIRRQLGYQERAHYQALTNEGIPYSMIMFDEGMKLRLEDAIMNEKEFFIEDGDAYYLIYHTNYDCLH